LGGVVVLGCWKKEKETESRSGMKEIEPTGWAKRRKREENEGESAEGGFGDFLKFFFENHATTNKTNAKACMHSNTW
jgi:hypothetical protein